MRVRRFVCVWVCVVQCAWAAVASVNAVFQYPDARRDESVVEDYHGTKVKDPYRWLEDPDSDETKAFVDGQNNITLPYLEACPEREAINKRIKELWDFPKYTSPFREGDRYYYFKNDGLQPQKILYTQDSLEGEPRVFFDPNTLSEDGTIALASFKFTKDGATFAYALSKKGSDWNTVYFRDVATGKDYSEKLEKVKFSSLAWTNDYKGLFYSAYPEQAGKTDGSETVANRDQKLCYHRLDTPQSEDVIVAEFPNDPLWRMNGDVSDDGRYLLVSVVKEYRDNLMFFADLSQYENITGLLPLKQIIFKFDAEYGYVTNDGSVCVFRTNKNAANYRLVKIDLDNPAEENWETVVEEHPKSVMNFVYPVDNDKLMIHYIKDVKSILQLHSLRTGEVLQTFEDFGVGTVVEFTGQRHQTEAFFYFWSYLTPGIIYHVDFNSTAPFKSEVFREIQLKDFDKSKFAFKQIFYPSKDGTSIPMYIVSKKDLPRNGCNPTLLYGYGGFNINSSPDFNIMRLVFMENFNGIVAIANIRGGGEYGERWYRAGRSLNKQNVFDDFQAAAEYLIAEQYTNPELLTIQGASNGGLLVAACINQRPDLYSAAIISIGVLDLLRFHKFTIGSAWVYDYGSSDNKTEFENLIKLSPLHNIRPPGDGRAQYPATLVLTADHDDRVVPLHSLKFIAALQHAVRGSAQARPLLARVDTKAGHGGGKPIGKIIQSDTDILCFIMQALQLKYVK